MISVASYYYTPRPVCRLHRPPRALSTHKGSMSRIFKGASGVQTEPGRASARPQGVLPDLLTQD